MRLPHENSYHIPGSSVIAGEYPFRKDPADGCEKLNLHIDAGITCFVDLTESTEFLTAYEPYVEDAARQRSQRIRYVRTPIRDMDIPDTASMARILETIEAAEAAGERVYVHCWGGVGRTGTVVGCYLVNRGLSGEAALEKVAELFNTTSREKVRRHHSTGSPQTSAQREFVRWWTPSTRAAAEPQPRLRDRLRGSLIGLAVGDAVGTTVEFKSPGSFRAVTDMIGGGPFRLEPGEWTDDTSMALCMGESLLEKGVFDARDQMERYVRWFNDGHLSSTGRCFDIGNATRTALDHFVRDGDPYAGSTDRYSAGNGSIMRLAPAAIFHAHSPLLALEKCAESSRTTHAVATAVDACRYLGALLLGAFNGVSKEELLAPFYSPVPGYWEANPLVPEIAEIAGGSFTRKSPPAINGSGYVVDTLEAALWAFHTTDNFRDGCLAVVNLGDDADSTAAVFGQIVGAYYGESGIPAEWREKLALWDTIDTMAEQLAAAGSGAPPEEEKLAVLLADA